MKFTHEEQLILRLIASGFTTQALHAIKQQYNTFDIAYKRMYPLLKNLLHQDNKLENKINYFNSLDIASVHSDLVSRHITPVFYNSHLYPFLLKQIYDFPFVLFCKGNLSILQNKKFLAIVGSRQRTAYTSEVIEMLMPSFVKHHITIVSGLAKGADSDAHLAANYHGGQTIGVLGFGHDYYYPSEVTILRRHMEQHHLVVSEYYPTTQIAKFQFPERNRLISGLSQGVLITEAKLRSGSLITCDQALDQNRNVYCLPGNITSVYSQGCNQKIAEGAKIIVRVEDILEDYLN
ncbi:DNA-processing protein DprA [Macrococcoides caseolyticum]|uniref:DNA-processing protein DprA n=1 Tax=Macrococcoides caseolyticum TaxID=69966 RepID=UPI001F3CFD34|nr:DNA-processing protein DprA [Macrococcus caseolyticus]MCE4956759.1 DNA-processing protein DprA [Macrococcus caseolyticus]